MWYRVASPNSLMTVSADGSVALESLESSAVAVAVDVDLYVFPSVLCWMVLLVL